jgi:putative chitinase
MPFETRQRSPLPTPGPFLAEITSHLDPTYMGSLEVSLIKNLQNSISKQGETYIVRYLNPFYGVTSVRYEGNNSSDFNDVQKSYGMWMVPPDVGTVVMVIFVDGDPNQGYWMGCVQDTFQNHMVPGLAATKNTAMTQQQKDRYGTEYLPTAEFLKSTQKLNDPNIDKIPKPIHPFADRLLAQGLLLDTVRGVTSSGARREVPSQVFGISTPGPLDTSTNTRKGKIGYEGNRQAPVSRLGGSTFVMDDGDITGQNELVRIRTRTGHQILLHNSQDLIYIANAAGTSWIELTSHGKLDIYAHDSVSIHTEADFNFRADRDVNIEAGRNINMRAMKNMETNVAGYYYLVVDDHSKIAIKNDLDFAVGQNVKFTASQDINIGSGKDILITASNEINVTSGSAFKIGTGGDFSVDANGNIVQTGSIIHMNGPAAPAPTAAQSAEVPPLLSIFSLPNRKVSAGWAKENKYATTEIKTIMQRVPTHEPYDQHENVNPAKFSSDATDVTLTSRAGGGVADNPNAGIQDSANTPEVAPGTCDVKYAKDINAGASQPGISALKEAAAKLGLTGSQALASLLGVAGGESRWKVVTESFNYTTAARLLEVFPTVFKGDTALAQQYVGNPNNSLPEFLYGPNTAKGKGLGNTQAGDGAKFVGRGFIQLTGRANYAKYSSMLYTKGLVSSPSALTDNPELLSSLTTAAQVSVLYFLDRVKLSQTDPGYFEAACRAVGYNTPDIHATKKGFYECFLGQLTSTVVGTGSNGILTDSQGNPVKAGQ